ncbi:hypothetical protein E2C01_003247 [Portunus trituberculatus]|uniref:Uncharacterized protein n=1 Tax=Portunus trituberculatus TaxID=210409 RepID=A0A5B7CME8_PORTR|nr:hypothetical protein [Portunus trituberculatus]
MWRFTSRRVTWRTRLTFDINYAAARWGGWRYSAGRWECDEAYDVLDSRNLSRLRAILQVGARQEDGGGEGKVRYWNEKKGRHLGVISVSGERRVYASSQYIIAWKEGAPLCNIMSQWMSPKKVWSE